LLAATRTPTPALAGRGACASASKLEAPSNQAEYINELEHNRDALLGHLEGVAPDALDSSTSEERHQVYKMLRLGVGVASNGSLEISGAFGNDLDFLEVTRYRG